MDRLLYVFLLVAIDYACATTTSPAPTTGPPVTTRYPPGLNCGGEQVGNSGFISSPKFPENYPNNAICAYFIQLKANITGAIKLTFPVFEVEKSENCKADSLKVHDGENGYAPVIANLCGKEPIKPIITSGKAVYLQFVTDVANTARGFNITWERATCEEAGGECAETCQHGELDKQRGTCDGSTLKCCKHPPPPSTDCGKRFISDGNTSYILGGTEAEPNSWPWMLSLQTVFGHFCGAVLLSDEWAVTGARCVNDFDVVTVVAGEHDRLVTSVDEVSVDTSKIIVHEDFVNSNPWPNDIALLKLSKKLKLGPKIFPACFPQKEDMDFWPDDNCYITGWGLIAASSAEFSTVLNEVPITVIPNSICRARYVFDTHICAGDGSTIACQGDGGGPLVCKKSGKWFLAGVSTYWTRKCETSTYPSIYTRVSKYKTWVDEKIKANGGY